jgi:GAF domain-containing protein
MSSSIESQPATLLQQALREAAAAQTPRSTARAVVAACVERLDAQRGGFYRLDLSTGAYVPFVRPDGAPELRVPVSGLKVPDTRIGPLEDFMSDAKDGGKRVEGVVVYVIRGGSCVGALRLDGTAIQDIDRPLREDLLASANLLALVYESEFAFNLLSELQQPLDFNEPDREFFALIGDLIRDSSRMEFVALREHVDGHLRCIALAGFGEDPDLRDWDLQPIERYQEFASALSGKTIAVSALDPFRQKALAEQPWSKNVRSFVTTPVNVGNEVFGVLSVAARCEFNYSQVELRGFESIANAVGVSITNFRNSRSLGIRVGEYAETAMAVTALEVARAVKHEALNCINTASAGLRNIWLRLGKPNVDGDIDDINDALRRVGSLVTTITSTPTSLAPGEWKRTSVRRVWSEAWTAVSGRLQEQRIDVRLSNADAEVYARPEWLRQVFLNLLLNSIDAFREAKKSGRRIDLVIDPQSPRSSEISVSYHDNATGISPQRLHAPPGAQELPVEQRIFQEGVTSKPKGSGFGLWLVRHILSEHFASIDLTDYRGGVTFILRFPKPEEAEAKMKEST